MYLHLLKESHLSDRVGFFRFIQKFKPRSLQFRIGCGASLFTRLILPDVLNLDQSPCSSPLSVLQQLPGIAGTMSNIADQPVAGIDHDFVGTHDCVPFRRAFQAVRMICPIKPIGSLCGPFSRMIRQHQHQGDRMLLFHAPDGGCCNPVKAAIPTPIELADILFTNQSINHQFQSGEQAFVCIPVTDEETAFHLSVPLIIGYE